jgi:maltose alpha-D-glucosyltransferase/alpha-amylase
VLFGKRFVMKVFRRIEPGPNPDVEIGDYLAARGFARVPPLVGVLSYAREGGPAASLAMLQEYIFNEGNGWHVTIEELARYFDRVTALAPPRCSPEEARAWALADGGGPPPAVIDAIGTYLRTAEVLGRRTGELHVQLADAPSDAAAFVPEPNTAEDLRRAAATMRRQAGDQFALLEGSVHRLDEVRRELALTVLSHRDELLGYLDEGPEVRTGGARIRCHGDYHLGQVLMTEGDVMILDFEGEPSRPLAERRSKCSPLRDVAGMLRSFGYAALTGLAAATATRPEDIERLAPWAEVWETWVSAAYFRAYLRATRHAPFLPSHTADLEAVLRIFLFDRALHELAYELNNRPEWVHIPLAGLLRLRIGSPLHTPVDTILGH